jgi:hypothetical protein
VAVTAHPALNWDSGTVTAPTLPPATGEAAAPAPARKRAPIVERISRAVRDAGSRLGRDASAPMSAWVLGPLAALWAAAIGLAIAVVPMLIAWMASADSGLTWTQALRLGGLTWVVAHGAPVTIAGVSISLLPWGLVVIPILLLGYAGGWAARRADVEDGAGVLRLALSGALTYTVVVGLIAVASAGPTSSASVAVAVPAALVISVLALGWGAARAAGFDLLRRAPLTVAVSLRAGLIAAVALIGLGALAAATSLLVHIDDAITMAQSLGAGIGGGLALTALGVAYVPVLALWGTAYVMGAGVVIGPAVTVTPFIASVAPTQLPPFPLLAALPQGATALAWILPLTGVLSGVVAGLVIARRARTQTRLVRMAMAGGAALVAGAILALGAFLASGSLGDLRLAQVGPVPLTVGVLGAVLIVLGAVPGAVAPASPARPALSVANAAVVAIDPDSVEPDSVDPDAT